MEQEGVASAAAPPVREILRLVVKAQKALRFYQGGNAISDRLESDLFQRLSSHLDEHGPLSLTIREFEILFEEQPVYQGEDRNDSLAFLLFRDGIRRLSFHPGLEAAELHAFLDCLNRVVVLSNQDDDLVTLFWEQDFRAIRYFAIEELAAESDGPRLEQHLASGRTEAGEAEEEKGSPADQVSLKDLEQPVSQLPVEACRLSDEEVESLRSELAGLESEPFHVAVVELAIELVLLETSEEEKERIADSMVGVADRLIYDGDIRALAGAVEHLSGLAEMVFASSAGVRRVQERLLSALTEPKRLEKALEQVERTRSLRPVELTAFLGRLGAAALPALVPAMGRMGTAAFRRAVADAVRLAGDAAADELARHLPSNGSAPDPNLLREMYSVLSSLSAGKALPLLEGLLELSDPAARREAALVLGRFKEPAANERFLRLLNDSDPEIRAMALDTLVLRGGRELARPILDASLGAPDFDERGLSEKRRIFAAVAKLGGVDALDWFADLLRRKDKKWFASRKEREAAEAAAHGLRLVGTPSAWELLRQMAREGDRLARTACAKELGAERKD